VTSTGAIFLVSIEVKWSVVVADGHGLEIVPEVEPALSALWSEVLGIDHIEAGDNFFELGGDSVMAASLMVRVFEVLELFIDPIEIFDAPTLREFAQRVESLQANLTGDVFEGAI